MARRPATTWLRLVWLLDSEGKSLSKVDGLVEISYIFNENADEDPKVRVSVKDEVSIGNKMKGAMLAEGNQLCWRM